MKSMLTAARQPENFSVKTFYERPSWSNELHIVCGSFSGIANREVSVSSPPKKRLDSRLYTSYKKRFTLPQIAQ